jgi:lysophospholipase L1-like esterase
VLTTNEISQIKNAVQGYNTTLLSLANQFDLAYIDMNSKLKELKNGIVTDGITLTDDFISGNSFSLDGIHLTAMGYAFVANQFILGINAKYGSNLPTVSLTNYQSVILP